MPPCKLPPTAAAIVKPRSRAPAVALILASLAWLATALSSWLVAASHTWTDGCLVDKPLFNGGLLTSVLGGLLSVGAGVTALISLVKPRARGASFAVGVAAMVMGAVSVMACLLLLDFATTYRAIDPIYLHPC